MTAPESAYLLSEFVCRRRKQLRLTFAQLAERAGLSEFTCKRIEHCNGGIHWESARKILKALNTTLAEYAAWERGILNE